MTLIRKIVSSALSVAFLFNICAYDISSAANIRSAYKTDNLSVALKESDILGQAELNRGRVEMSLIAAYYKLLKIDPSITLANLEEKVRPNNRGVVSGTSRASQVSSLQKTMQDNGVQIFFNTKPATDMPGIWFRCWILNKEGKRQATYYANLLPRLNSETKGSMDIKEAMDIKVYTETEFNDLNGKVTVARPIARTETTRASSSGETRGKELYDKLEQALNRRIDIERSGGSIMVNNGRYSATFIRVNPYPRDSDYNIMKASYFYQGASSSSTMRISNAGIWIGINTNPGSDWYPGFSFDSNIQLRIGYSYGDEHERCKICLVADGVSESVQNKFRAWKERINGNRIPLPIFFSADSAKTRGYTIIGEERDEFFPDNVPVDWSKWRYSKDGVDTLVSRTEPGNIVKRGERGVFDKFETVTETTETKVRASASGQDVAVPEAEHTANLVSSQAAVDNLFGSVHSAPVSMSAAKTLVQIADDSRTSPDLRDEIYAGLKNRSETATASPAAAAAAALVDKHTDLISSQAAVNNLFGSVHSAPVSMSAAKTLVQIADDSRTPRGLKDEIYAGLKRLSETATASPAAAAAAALVDKRATMSDSALSTTRASSSGIIKDETFKIAGKEYFTGKKAEAKLHELYDERSDIQILPNGLATIAYGLKDALGYLGRPGFAVMDTTSMGCKQYEVVYVPELDPAVNNVLFEDGSKVDLLGGWTFYRSIENTSTDTNILVERGRGRVAFRRDSDRRFVIQSGIDVYRLKRNEPSGTPYFTFRASSSGKDAAAPAAEPTANAETIDKLTHLRDQLKALHFRINRDDLPTAHEIMRQLEPDKIIYSDGTQVIPWGSDLARMIRRIDSVMPSDTRREGWREELAIAKEAAGNAFEMVDSLLRNLGDTARASSNEEAAINVSTKSEKLANLINDLPLNKRVALATLISMTGLSQKELSRLIPNLVYDQMSDAHSLIVMGDTYLKKVPMKDLPIGKPIASLKTDMEARILSMTGTTEEEWTTHFENLPPNYERGNAPGWDDVYGFTNSSVGTASKVPTNGDVMSPSGIHSTLSVNPDVTTVAYNERTRTSTSGDTADQKTSASSGKFRFTTRVIEAIMAGKAMLEPAARDNQGNTWIANYDTNTITALNENGTHNTNFGRMGIIPIKSTKASFLSGVLIDNQNNIWVSDRGDNTISVFNKDGTPNMNFGKEGVISSKDIPLSSPSAMALDSEGNILVANYYNSTILVLNQDGTLNTNFGKKGVISSASALLSEPKGMTIDSEGNIWVANFGNSTISVLDKDGKLNTNFGEGGVISKESAQLSSPYRITIKSNGDIYVANFGNSTFSILTPAAQKSAYRASSSGDVLDSDEQPFDPVQALWNEDTNRYRPPERAPRLPDEYGIEDAWEWVSSPGYPGGGYYRQYDPAVGPRSSSSGSATSGETAAKDSTGSEKLSGIINDLPLNKRVALATLISMTGLSQKELSQLIPNLVYDQMSDAHSLIVMGDTYLKKVTMKDLPSGKSNASLKANMRAEILSMVGKIERAETYDYGIPPRPAGDAMEGLVDLFRSSSSGDGRESGGSFRDRNGILHEGPGFVDSRGIIHEGEDGYVDSRGRTVIGVPGHVNHWGRTIEGTYGRGKDRAPRSEDTVIEASSALPTKKAAAKPSASEDVASLDRIRNANHPVVTADRIKSIKEGVIDMRSKLGRRIHHVLGEFTKYADGSDWRTAGYVTTQFDHITIFWDKRTWTDFTVSYWLTPAGYQRMMADLLEKDATSAEMLLREQMLPDEFATKVFGQRNRASSSGAEEDAVTIDNMTTLADQVGKNIPVGCQLFVPQTLVNQKECDGIVAAKDNKFEAFAFNGKDVAEFILGRAQGKEDRAIVLVTTKTMESDKDLLTKLKTAGIRFLITRDSDISGIKELGDAKEACLINIFATMLIARAIPENAEEGSPLYQLLRYYLQSQFDLEGIAVEDYINAIAGMTIEKLIKGFLNPLKPFNMQKELVDKHNGIAQALISA